MSELQLEVSDILRNQLIDELDKLKNDESIIDAQLKDYFYNLSGSQLQQYQQQQQHKKSIQMHTPPILTASKKIDDFSPCFEAISQDTKKLSNQIGECRILSEQMSKIVRRLDNMQIRAQLGLACTEDIINLKECKIKMTVAMEEHNLPLAVNYLRQFHDIDEDAAKASDDIGALQQAERELKELVKTEFNKAISESNIEMVMSLCPLLQTLGLEIDAREQFLSFMESSIFIAVSADLATTTTTTTTNNDPNNPTSENSVDSMDTYIQSLSSVFNSTYLIFQNYLPIIIKGMETSYGDIYFIRKLHTHCEKQSAIVLKRYVKFRNLKQVIQNMSSSSTSSKNIASTKINNNNNSNTSNTFSSSELHMILDELTLLIQYCCVYSKYLTQLCQGAESRNRIQISTILKYSTPTTNHQLNNNNTTTTTATTTTNTTTNTIDKVDGSLVVFNTPPDFHHMVEELVNRYYIEGEVYLMKQSVKSAHNRLTEIANMNNITRRSCYSTGLDECFFVLKRCGQRALMTNNIQASCAVLRIITDLIISDLHIAVSNVVNNAINKIVSIIQSYLNEFLKSAKSNCQGVDDDVQSYLEGQSSNTLGSDFNSVVNVLGLKNAMSLVTRNNDNNTNDTNNTNTGTRTNDTDDDDDEQEPDIWGMANYKSLISITELCIRYSEQLSKEITSTGSNIYGLNNNIHTTPAKSTSMSITRERNNSKDISSSMTSASSSITSATSEAEKLKMCIDDFDNAKKTFSQVNNRYLYIYMSYQRHKN